MLDPHLATTIRCQPLPSLRHAMGPRTFIVEDNPTIRNNLVATLVELADVQVVGQADAEDEGRASLAHLGSGWDLVIVDLFLRQGSGLGVIAALRMRQPHQKLVVLSNYATPDIRRKCLQGGADAVFDKSNEIDALIEFCMRLAGPAP